MRGSVEMSCYHLTFNSFISLISFICFHCLNKRSVKRKKKSLCLRCGHCLCPDTKIVEWIRCNATQQGYWKELIPGRYNTGVISKVNTLSAPSKVRLDRLEDTLENGGRQLQIATHI